MTKAEIIAELRRVATSEYEDAYDAAEGAFGAGLDFREPSPELT